MLDNQTILIHIDPRSIVDNCNLTTILNQNLVVVLALIHHMIWIGVLFTEHWNGALFISTWNQSTMAINQGTYFHGTITMKNISIQFFIKWITSSIILINNTLICSILTFLFLSMSTLLKTPTWELFSQSSSLWMNENISTRCTEQNKTNRPEREIYKSAMRHIRICPVRYSANKLLVLWKENLFSSSLMTHENESICW